MFRAYRVRSTGQWCAALMEDAHFNDDGLERAEILADMLGLPQFSLEVVIADEDPRSGVLLDVPAPPPPPPLPERPEKVARDALRSATTVAQIKSALDDYFAARGG